MRARITQAHLFYLGIDDFDLRDARGVSSDVRAYEVTWSATQGALPLHRVHDRSY